MKHPKDRGDRIRGKRNAQHQALRSNGLFRPKVEQDKREKIVLKTIDTFHFDEDEDDYER